MERREDLSWLDLHKRIEERINAEESVGHFEKFGLNGELYQYLRKDIVLKIIEEEFCK